MGFCKGDLRDNQISIQRVLEKSSLKFGRLIAKFSHSAKKHIEKPLNKPLYMYWVRKQMED